MKTYTVSSVMAAKPCSQYSEERVASLWAGRESLTAREISDLEIPIVDRIWGLIRVCMDARTQRLFGCDCAERALMRESEAGREPDARSWNAISVSRRFAYGSATSEELDAAWDAASAAVWNVARDAASAAACAAASAAACAAARDAARDAERAWQLAHALEMIEAQP